MRNRISIVSAAVAPLILAPAAVMASSHGEAPYIKSRPKVDATDFYVFNSYEAGREDFVTLIANYQPLQDVYGGPNFFTLNDKAIYEIHVDNDGDAVEDITFVFDFDNALANGEAGLALQIGDQSVPVPVKNIGSLGDFDNQSVLNVNETYFVGMVLGDRRSGSPDWSVRPNSGLRLFTKPSDNIGDKSFPTGYENYVKSLSNTNEIYYDVEFAQCPEGANQGRVFVGQRKESFSIALAEIFDLVNFAPLVDALPDDPARNDLFDKNITTLSLEVHKDCLTGSGNGVIGAWTSSSVRSSETISDDPSFRDPSLFSGEFRQVSRLSNPLVNEVVIGLPDKDRFNASEPVDDAQFATYVTNPTLPAILDILFRDVVGATSNIAPANLPRTDLVTAFLTGFQGVNQLQTVTASEMLRLNTGIPATARDDQLNLGVVAGDLAGFPNGRRPGDDVTDIALRVMMGALCHPIAVDLDASGTAGDAGDVLGLCATTDAPVGTAAFTDGSPQNSNQFSAIFPYLTTPVVGSMSDNGDVMDDGVTDDGTTDDSVTDGGMTDDGVMDDGTADNGAVDDGSDVIVMCPTGAELVGNSLSSTQIELLWDAFPGEVSGYNIFMDGSFLSETDTTNLDVEGLDPGVEYLFEVFPLDAEGNTIACRFVVAVTTDQT
ncbi:DUF4331 family protein [Granulosicoccus sp.]|nr:DUF4331 family protein [Granulosicoccus sp.]